MKNFLIFSFSLALILPSVVVGSGSNRESTQAQLDAKCEAARERKLAPERTRYVDECVRNKIRDGREACERFYVDHGARSGERAPLYYDLPECVSAFEFRNNYRQR
jgi:hypothetical protein